jgi:hypothetical protein
MTVGELILLRTLREAFDLPVEVVKMIIRNLNLRGRVQYNRRRRLPRYYDITLKAVGHEPRTDAQYHYWDHGPRNSAFLGPGF